MEDINTPRLRNGKLNWKESNLIVGYKVRSLGGKHTGIISRSIAGKSGTMYQVTSSFNITEFLKAEEFEIISGIGPIKREKSTVRRLKF